MDPFSRAFLRKLNDDGVERDLSDRRYMALKGRFGGYMSSDCVQKTCVCPGETFSWLDTCYGLKWVAVHGLEAICIVIKPSDVDMTLLGPFYRGLSEELVMFSLTGALLSEIGDLADELRKRYGKVIEKPFGVVSVNHSHEEGGHEASGADFDEDKAIAFLEEKMKRNRSEYTYEKTIQTAISAFQHLCPEELYAEDIFVCVCQDIDVAPYNMSVEKTKEQLALINGCSSLT